ncbi:MAG: hypothetical protein GX767_07440 [Firmicutes bacterium]|nr:hypothetical protein [Bacillota bacterium]
MRSRRRRSLLLVTFLFLAIVLVYFFSPSVQAAVTTENLSVVMVIDVSGSMSSTDPQRLRESAACIFIDLLAPEDRLGGYSI